jgi:hypothetical protein
MVAKLTSRSIEMDHISHKHGPLGPFNGDTCLEQEFLRLRDAYGIGEVIETGTHFGLTTQWLAKNFSSVQTIELSEQRYRIAANRLSQYKNVKQWLGSSTAMLIDALGHCSFQLTELIIYLDARRGPNPVLAELDQIRLSGKKPILIIHDFKNPNHPEFGYDKYPSQGIVYKWEYRDIVAGIYGEIGFHRYYNNRATGAKRGCLFVIPRTAP